MLRFNCFQHLNHLLMVGVCSALWCNATAQPDSADIDLSFTHAPTTGSFTAHRGAVHIAEGNLNFRFNKGAVLDFPSFEGSRHLLCNPRLERRNTILCITEKDRHYDDAKSKTFALQPNTPKQAYYLNLSDVPSARGRLAGLKFELLGGKGELIVDRISFEQERAIEPMAGTIDTCIAIQHNLVGGQPSPVTEGTIRITGTIEPQYLEHYPQLALYETSMKLPNDQLDSMKCLYRGKASSAFCIDNIPLMAEDSVSRLSSQLMAIVQNAQGEWVRITPRFYLSNWRDFSYNPYAFQLPERSVSVASLGAKGDGFTDDTRIIQHAIDSIAQLGGGQVILTGDTSRYGRRYVVTHLDLRSHIDLHIERGAILWQSQDPADYPYKPSYGHEGVIPGVNWTHSMHVSNLPLIQGKSIDHVKITGNGQIRMMDPESQDPHYTQADYQRYCTDRIHVIPIGMWGVSDIEVSDVEIVRSNNYHTAFYACQNLFIGNLKMHEVQCVSGDGMGLGVGTHNVMIARTFLETNDDGVVLWAGYNDPRGILWWWARPEADNSIRNIVVYHSYISSARPTPENIAGGGKAIAFIPWGTDAPHPDQVEIDGITVFDCVLNGGYAVGTWPDNPYFGKQPFDNSEQDDYSAVKNVRITHNRYLSLCDISPIIPTNFISDCGIHSSDHFVNDSFKSGLANWTAQGVIEVNDGVAQIKGGDLYQGLYLAAGRYTLKMLIDGRCTAFVEAAPLPTDELPTIRIRHQVDHAGAKEVTFTVDIPQEGTYFVGIRGADVRLHSAQIVKQ